MPAWLKAEVSEKTRWNSRLFSLRIRITGREGEDMEPVDFAFTAGQFVRIALDIEGERIARPYSLVNVPGSDHLEVFFNIVPDGPLSPRLAELEPGDSLFVAEKANGFLVVDEVPECRHLWMIATGTGVGPFLSILASGDAWQRFERAVLVYSVRDQSELCYRDQLAAIAESHPGQFHFIPVVTREQVAGALNQRVTDAARDGSMEQHAGIAISAENSHVMLCGNSEMISDVTGLLTERGMKKHLRREPGHYSTEKYH